jgi:hypothetical protein
VDATNPIVTRNTMAHGEHCMKSSAFRTLLGLMLTCANSIAFSQGLSDGNLGAACSGCLVFIVILIVINIALLVWVARDAKNRGMDGAVIWMLLVMFTSFLGLIIYLFSRPKGFVIYCGHCGNKRLQASAKCPHCGNS